MKKLILVEFNKINVKNITMRTIKILIISICFFACKKNENHFTPVASINAINAVIDLASIKINTIGKKSNYAMITDQIAFGTNRIYYGETGTATLTAVASSDTTKLLFNKSVELTPDIYTMYIMGQMPNIDTLFRKEVNFPFIKTDVSKPSATDSVVNIRFVNLSPNSPSLVINIRNNTVNEFNNLPYKTISSWKPYPAKLITTNYIFEIRNAATNTILTSYTLIATTSNRFKNVSLIIKGLAGTTSGTNAFSVFPVNYF